MRWFVCTLLVGCCLRVFGQCPTVGITVDETDPSSVVVDTDFSPESRKLFVIGYYTRASMTFAGEQLLGVGSTNNSEGNMFLLQYSDSGLDWMRPIGRAYSSSTSARVKALNDGAIVGVKFIDTVDVGGVHISSGYENALLLRVDAEGSILWVRHLDSDGFCRVSAIDTDEHRNIYAYGHYQDNLRIGGLSIQATGNISQTQTELFLAKFNAEGDALWLRHFAGGTGWDDAEKLMYKDGKLYLSGFFAGQLNFGQTTLTSSSNQNGFLCKADTSGDVIWVSQLISGSVRELAIECITNEVLLAGTFQEQMTVGTDVVSASGSRDGFVASFDSSGSVDWIRSIGGAQNDAVTHLEKVTDELFLLSGRAMSDFVVDGHEFVNHSTVGQGNAFTLLVDSEGAIQCINPIPSSDESQVWVSHLSADTVWQVGLYQSDVTVGDTTFNCPMPCGASFFVAKTCMGCEDLIKLDAPTIERQEILFDVYPNPFTTQTQLNYRTTQGTRPTLQLTDMLGRTVQTVQLLSHEGTYTLDAAALGTGIYFCSLVNGVEVLATQKLVVSSKE